MWNVRHEPLTCAIQRVPALGHVQRRDSDEFATIEAHQRRINQFTDLHDLGKRIDVDAGALPDFRAGCGRQHRLHVDPAGRQLEIQSLRQEQHEGFGGAVDRHTELRCQTHHRARPKRISNFRNPSAIPGNRPFDSANYLETVRHVISRT